MEEIIGGEAFKEEFFAGQTGKQTRISQKIAIDGVKRLNDDQKAAFDRIAAALKGEIAQKLFFVKGAGGTGTIMFSLRLFILLLKGKHICTTQLFAG